MSWRRHSTSIVLVFVAVALAAWIWIDRASVTDTERAQRPNNVFSVFRREGLSRIEIAHGTEKLVLVRDIDRDADAAWRVESPEAGAADPSAVDQLTSTLEFATVVRKVSPSASPTFDSPRATGSITMGKVVTRFALGGAAPVPEGASYLKVDEAVVVVSKELSQRLLMPASTYRSRTIVPYLSLDLASLDIHRKDGDLHVDRAGELVFKLGGTGLRASREQLDKLWSAFAEMRADSFTDAPVGDPVLTIAMTPKDGRARGEIVVGGACPDHPDDVVVARKAPTPLGACAPRGVIEGLSQTAADLVDARLFFAHEDELEELELAGATGDKIEIARKGSGWHARAPFDRDLVGDEVDAANTLVSSVIRAKGTAVARVVPDEPFTVRAHVRVHGGEMPEDELVDVGEGPHGWVVHRLADGARLDVTAEVARYLRPSKSALKGRDVILPVLDPKDVRAVGLRCGTPQDIVRDGSSWTFERPKGYVADAAAILDLVEQVAHLRAESWVADADDGTFGFSGSTCTVTMQSPYDGGTRNVKLVLGRDTESGVYAWVQEGPAASPVFLEPRTFRDSLARIVVDRSSLAIDTPKASDIVLSRQGARVELRRVADRLVGPDAGLLVGIPAITGALDTLRADDVVHLGLPLADEGFGAPSLEVQVDNKTLRFGRDVLRKNQAMVLVRVSGIDATFAVARERVDPLRKAL